MIKRLEERRIKISFRDSALNLIADLGYDPSFGARPVKRAIQTYLENPLSQLLLEGEFDTEKTIVVDSDGEKLKFEVE